MQLVGIIPARYQSSRFPGKPLVDIFGKSMVQRVYERACEAKELDEVWVATDDARIVEHVERFGGRAMLTLESHTSGTERCHEASALLNRNADAIINIQGDEPYIHPGQISELCRLIRREDVHIATLVKRIEDPANLLNPNKVKVVLDQANRALYFSRSAIPFYRDLAVTDWLKRHDYYKHIGLYGYKTKCLQEIVHLAPSALERAESLEQLRWLEHGKRIHCGITRHESPAIDTPEDLQALLDLGADGALK
jgi:3-deoxy-manno-octulosonate cytidylyltransferase (CMP-KDO synthetase)